MLANKKKHLATSVMAMEWMLEKEKRVRSRLEQQGKLNAMDVINELGRSDYTISFAPAYAHTDRYPKIPVMKDPDKLGVDNNECRMQGKVTLPMGPKQKSAKLAEYGVITDKDETDGDNTIGYQTLSGNLPPGTLFLTRYNLASMCKAKSDVEIHCLHDEDHCSAASGSSTNNMAHRGVWIDEDGLWCFYPEGYAITAY
jgi:hypothetical protein